MASFSDSAQGPAPAAIDRVTEDRFRDVAASAPPAPSRTREEHLSWVLEQVRQSLSAMRFGQVVITVQDGLPIQIERTEKTRLR
jgi:hypothetical protein